MNTNAGNEARLAAWLAQHGAIVRRLSRVYATDAADRQDLHQEMLIQLWRSLPSFREQARESTWIYRVCLNTALTWKRAWQRRQALAATGACARAEAGAVRLVHEVRGKARSFERAIARRDARESFGALLVAAVFGWVGWLNWSAGRPSWTCWIAAALAFAVAAFLLIDRFRARRSVRPRGAAVAAELERAIAEGRHQYWLFTKVVWWYLLPLGSSVGMIVLHVVLYSPQSWWLRAAIASAMLGVTLVLYVALWRRNLRGATGELRSWIAELEDRRRQVAA